MGGCCGKLMYEIDKPVWIKGMVAHFSLSDYTFKKYAKRGKLGVKVLKDNIPIGTCEVDQAKWIRTAKEVIPKVYYRPDEPIMFYYNTAKLEPIEKQMTPEERSDYNVKMGII